MEKKVLILGNSAKEYALAKKISEKYEVFVAPGSPAMSDFVTCVDIRDNATKDLLEYSVENNISLVISASISSMLSDVADVFSRHNIPVFSPSRDAVDILLDKTSAKRLLYKLKIPTPRFGIFDKQAMAVDYIKKISGPFVLKSNDPSSAIVLNSLETSNNILDTIFSQKSGKIIIEDYLYGLPFTYYAITDGYKSLPFLNSLIYKGALDGEGGQLTSGMGACSPNYKISFAQEEFLMNNVVNPIVEYLQKNDTPYLGILGVNGILLTDGTISILGFEPFLQDCDCAGIIELLNDDIYNLFNSCIIGSFSDEVDYISIKNLYATSVVLNCNYTQSKENVITGLNNIEDNISISFYNNVIKNKYLEYEVNQGQNLLITSIARTPATAIKSVYENIKDINFQGKSYRKDICKNII